MNSNLKKKKTNQKNPTKNPSTFKWLGLHSFAEDSPDGLHFKL